MIELGISDNRALKVIGSTPGDPLRLFSVVAVELPEDRGYRLTKSLGVDKDSYRLVSELSIR